MSSSFFTTTVAAALLITVSRAQTFHPVAVGPIGMNVADMDRSVSFFRDVLTFEKISDSEFHAEAYDRLQGVFGARVRIVDLRLGQETLRLTQYLTPPSRPVPIDSRSNDLWFQHIAVVVRDMDTAYARLREHKVLPVSTAPQKLPEWNKNAAGIRAFYFRDPDNHNLELISFPPGKGDPRWHQETPALFLGIDHTAITVSDTESSLRFYRDELGLHVVGESENYGPEQEYLNHVFGAHLRITSLRAPRGPGIEFLEYLSPRDGRPLSTDALPTDLTHWETTILVSLAEFTATQTADVGAATLGMKRAQTVQDPDRHTVKIAEP